MLKCDRCKSSFPSRFCRMEGSRSDNKSLCSKQCLKEDDIELIYKTLNLPNVIIDIYDRHENPVCITILDWRNRWRQFNYSNLTDDERIDFCKDKDCKGCSGIKNVLMTVEKKLVEKIDSFMNQLESAFQNVKDSKDSFTFCQGSSDDEKWKLILDKLALNIARHLASEPYNNIDLEKIKKQIEQHCVLLNGYEKSEGGAAGAAKS